MASSSRHDMFESLIEAMSSINVTENDFSKTLRRMKTRALYELRMEEYTADEKKLIQQEKERRRQKSKNKPTVGSWSMFPEHHTLIQSDLAQMRFHPPDTNSGVLNKYDTNIMGSFDCENGNCKKDGWSSKVIPITIRLYKGNKYNARVYHQRCTECDHLSKPVLDVDSYVDRVTYRLKVWLGYSVQPPPYFGASKGPHEEEFCEGCKDGHCVWSKRNDDRSDR